MTIVGIVDSVRVGRGMTGRAAGIVMGAGADAVTEDADGWVEVGTPACAGAEISMMSVSESEDSSR